MICALTGLDVANASLYDGATAAAEAMMLAVQATGRDRIAVSGAVHPETLRVLRTFAAGRAVSVDVVATHDDVTLVDDARAVLTDRHAGLLVQQPTFYGTLESLAELADVAHAAGALALCSADPLACSVLLAPGDAGFDVCVGDGQPLGVPASFGGPHVGYMAVRQSLVRRMPGRLVGITADHAGRRAYTLTLQTREQHIRREHATSNICTNHALVALAATVYMAHMGAGGIARWRRSAHSVPTRSPIGSSISRASHWRQRRRSCGNSCSAARRRRRRRRPAAPPGHRRRPTPGSRRPGAHRRAAGLLEMTPPAAIDHLLAALGGPEVASLRAARVTRRRWRTTATPTQPGHRRPDGRRRRRARLGRGGARFRAQRTTTPAAPASRPPASPPQPSPTWSRRHSPAASRHRPAVPEPVLVRHVGRLARRNHHLHHSMYPLGSCTIKYNPSSTNRWRG